MVHWDISFLFLRVFLLLLRYSQRDHHEIQAAGAVGFAGAIMWVAAQSPLDYMNDMGKIKSPSAPSSSSEPAKTA